MCNSNSANLAILPDAAIGRLQFRVVLAIHLCRTFKLL